MRPELNLFELSELLEVLQGVPAFAPLRLDAKAMGPLAADAASIGISLVEINLLDAGTDSDFLITINAALKTLRLSDLLSNLGKKKLTHIFLLSSLHQIDESMGLRILAVVQAFAGTSIRFCILLPQAWDRVKLGAARKVLEDSTEVLFFAPADQVVRANDSQEATLIKRFKKLEQSVRRLDERTVVLESRGQMILDSVKRVNLVSLMDSLRPSPAFLDKIESRIEKTAQQSTAISTRLSAYK